MPSAIVPARQTTGERSLLRQLEEKEREVEEEKRKVKDLEQRVSSSGSADAGAPSGSLVAAGPLPAGADVAQPRQRV